MSLLLLFNSSEAPPATTDYSYWAWDLYGEWLY